MVKPSSSSTGTLPVGFLARQAGVARNFGEKSMVSTSHCTPSSSHSQITRTLRDPGTW